MKTTVRLRKSPGFDKFFESLPRMSRGLAVNAASEYVIGDERHGLKHEPKYLYVSRTTAYGQPFSSDKQRRWFFCIAERWRERDNGGILHTRQGEQNSRH